MTQSPHVFLLNGDAEGVPDPALAYFTERLLEAVCTVDPTGEVYSRLKVGLPLLSDFAGRITAVSSSPNRSSHTTSYDMDVYKSLLWDFRNALTEGWHSVDPDTAMSVVGHQTCECITLTDLPLKLRSQLDRELRAVPGYIGAFALDPGNPIHRRAFSGGLIYLAAIMHGAVVQELSIEGERDWPTSGGPAFRPGGLIWKPYGWLHQNGPEDISDKATSERGMVTVQLVRTKRKDRPENRVLDSLAHSSTRGLAAASYSFNLSNYDNQVLEAVLPDTKFTHFLFNAEHKEGAGKAKFFVEELGIAPEDWRFLAAQFYDGLVLAQPRAIDVRSWDGGYGARFNAHIRITGRNGKRAVVRTGWMLRPGTLPQLSTAFPEDDDAAVVDAPLPPILSPQLQGDARWATLFDVARTAAQEAHDATVPTPMFLEGFQPVPEGACGSAFVVVYGAREGFGSWLLKTGNGDRLPRAKVGVKCAPPTQSHDRAVAYAKAFARILLLNGVKAEIEDYYT